MIVKSIGKHLLYFNSHLDKPMVINCLLVCVCIWVCVCETYFVTTTSLTSSPTLYSVQVNVLCKDTSQTLLILFISHFYGLAKKGGCVDRVGDQWTCSHALCSERSCVIMGRVATKESIVWRDHEVKAHHANKREDNICTIVKWHCMTKNTCV